MPSKNRSDNDLAAVRTPRFRSEIEEAVWWDANLDQILEQGIDHLQSRQALRTVTIRLLERDVVVARALAAKRGLPYQTYLKTVIHAALQSDTKKVLKARASKRTALHT